MYTILQSLKKCILHFGVFKNISYFKSCRCLNNRDPENITFLNSKIFMKLRATVFLFFKFLPNLNKLKYPVKDYEDNTINFKECTRLSFIK
jgi:hypothetical protein